MCNHSSRRYLSPSALRRLHSFRCIVALVKPYVPLVTVFDSPRMKHSGSLFEVMASNSSLSPVIRLNWCPSWWRTQGSFHRSVVLLPVIWRRIVTFSRKFSLQHGLPVRRTMTKQENPSQLKRSLPIHRRSVTLIVHKNFAFRCTSCSPCPGHRRIAFPTPWSMSITRKHRSREWTCSRTAPSKCLWVSKRVDPVVRCLHLDLVEYAWYRQ